MVYVKWVFIVGFWGLVASALHYTLPQYDLVRVVDTEVRRVDFGENSIFWAQQDAGQEGSTSVNRDVRFINTVRASNGRVIVYRNEDTGWGWPPYFKVNSSNLQTEAQDLASTKDSPNWVVVRHYGWRNEFMSIYPNAVKVRSADGPDVRIINWFNIIFLTVFFAIIYAIWVRWRRFRKARIDPMLDDMSNSLEAAGDAVADKRGRLRRWFGTWRS